VDPEVVEQKIAKFLNCSHWSGYIHFSSGIKYYGEDFDQTRHGFGRLTALNDEKLEKTLYEGLFLCGCIHSKNAALFNTKGVPEFIGEVFGGRKLNGKEFHWTGKVRYDGPFENGEPSGNDCKIYDPNGKLECHGKVKYGRYIGQPLSPCTYDSIEGREEKIKQNRERFAQMKALEDACCR
jgi:hypothetical protein